MLLILVILGVISILELLLWTPLWRRNRPIAGILILALAIVSLALLTRRPLFWNVILVFFNLYRILNLWRLVKGRINLDYLYSTASLTSLWLIGLQVAALALAGLSSYYHVSLLSIFYAVAVGQVVVGIILLASTLEHLRTARPPKISATYADHDLPDLSVAIPARNETANLEACLRSLVDSDYPKLEILVLDDCSQNKRTPEVIRSFAQDGVRFIAGQAPPEHWLAKNYAYKQLSEAANGELLLFCGVDARFEPGSVRALVEILLDNKKNMLSILPSNQLSKGWQLVHMLVQPNRYSWELSLPRRLLKRPPVLSTCWLIRRQALEDAGGLAAVSRKVIPESYFARQTAKSDDGYGFVYSDAAIAIASHKSFDEQRATTIRTRYPQLHRRPEMVAMISLAEFSALLWPIIMLVGAILGDAWLLALLSGLAYLLVAASYDKVVNLTYRKVIIGGMWLLPVAILYDIGILNYSMWKYEFRDVIWKGRNVCIPVMRLVPGAAKPD